ncbi:MAG: CRTAC1 family protein [Planctomycetaceae bacterium]|nr:MAG: CRTAC1 family protein [Planctomycetaceae bacterium]
MRKRLAPTFAGHPIGRRSWLSDRLRAAGCPATSRSNDERRAEQPTNPAAMGPRAVGVCWLSGLSLLMLVLTNGCKRAEPIAERDAPPAIPAPAQTGSPAEPRTAVSGAIPADASPLRFTDITHAAGVDFTYSNGEDQQRFTILESLGGGIGVIDYDRDGRPDLFCPGGGTFSDDEPIGFASQLFRNLDGERMEAVGEFAGEGFPPRFYTHGAFVADYNQDGFPDVLVTGYGGLQLWQNQGDGTFIEVHESVGLHDDAWSSAAAWADFNNDGILDLYVAHYVDWSFENHPFCRGRTSEERDICPPREFAGLPDKLYLGTAEGTFRDVSEEWQLRSDGKGLGVLVADFDGNGQVDVYVANDTTNNFLYANGGQAPFREIATIAGVAADKSGIPNGSMGVDLLDFNRSGRPDIWVTNYEREDFALYRNEGPNAFLHVSDITGLNVLGGLFVGFGTVCADFDLDGREDIMVNNGHVILYPTASPRAQQPIVMLADERRFRRLLFDDENYFSKFHEGRGLAAADLDGDGDLDVIFSNINAPLAILRNDGPGDRNWLQVRLVGTRSNRDAIGAIVRVTIEGQEHVRFRKGGGSYLSTSQEALSWGLGDAQQIERLTVRWPSGAESVVENLAVNQTLTLVEPAND